jgi:membrane protein
LGTFFRNLNHQINEDDIFNGAAALSFYLLLALFPAMIFLLSMIPYLPIENLHQAIMDFIGQVLPEESAGMLSGVVAEVTENKSSGLLSFGIIATIWTSSAGLYAIMQQLNKTNDIKEKRPFWKARGTSILMTLVFGIMVLGAFALIVFGGVLQNFLAGQFGYQSVLVPTFAILRWVVIAMLLLLGFAVIYHYGPDVKKPFQLISVGSVVGVLLLGLASIVFQYYVSNFANYAATYGSIGAVIILMLYLYIMGVVILLGSEINVLIEHFRPEFKETRATDKGEKGQPDKIKRRPLPV